MKLIQLDIRGISYSETQSGAYALLLSEVEGERKLPVIIGSFEAQAIAIALEKEIKPVRPLTHDLFKSFADRFEIRVKQVIIHKLVDGIFYASMICEHQKIEEIIDARTSDAIALALRYGAPIFTYESILKKAGFKSPVSSNPGPKSSEEKWIRNFISEQVDDPLPQDLTKVSMDELQKLLDTLVKKEDYEKAAKVRDEIERREKS